VVFLLIKFAVQDFLDEKEFMNLSEKTISAYKVALKEFHRWCTEQEIIDVTEITTNNIKKYLLYCKNERKNNPVTLNSKLKNLRAFFNHLLDQEYIKVSPCAKINTVITDLKIEVFTDDHIQQMLNYYRRLKNRDKTFFAFRDHTIIVTLLGTGIRLGELCNLKWTDIDFESYQMIVWGKNRTQASVPLTDKIMKEFLEYKMFTERNFSSLNEYVFVNRYNKKLTENAVQNVFKRLKEIMNFKDVRLSAHTFRHTFAHRCLMNGMDVFTLQKMLRHKKLNMTERYLAIWGTALKEQNDKFNPLNNMDI